MDRQGAFCIRAAKSYGIIKVRGLAFQIPLFSAALLSVKREREIVRQKWKGVILVRCPTRPMSVPSSVGFILTFSLLLPVTLDEHSALPPTLPRLVGVQAAWNGEKIVITSSIKHLQNQSGQILLNLRSPTRP